MASRIFISKNESELTTLKTFLKDRNEMLIAKTFLQFSPLAFQLERPFDIIFFGSPRAVMFFKAQMDIPASAKIACVSGKTVEEAYKKGNKLLSCIKKYMILNKLHINMSKCCFVHFKPKASKPVESPDTLQLHIDGFPIKKTKATKFLGVVIDEQLSWGLI